MHMDMFLDGKLRLMENYNLPKVSYQRIIQHRDNYGTC